MSLSNFNTYDSTKYNSVIKTAFNPPDLGVEEVGVPDPICADVIWDGGAASSVGGIINTIYFRMIAPTGSAISFDSSTGKILATVPNPSASKITFYCSVVMDNTVVTSRTIEWSVGITSSTPTNRSPGTWIFVKSGVKKDEN